MPVDYSKPEVPKDYVCKDCGATNCKLWREYMLPKLDLFCANCASKKERRDISSIDSEGMRVNVTGGERIDRIGWYVPAIPGEDGLGYWGYFSIPDAGRNWWKRLPTLPAK